jgi:putative transcriptional regulator
MSTTTATTHTPAAIRARRHMAAVKAYRTRRANLRRWRAAAIKAWKTRRRNAGVPADNAYNWQDGLDEPIPMGRATKVEPLGANPNPEVEIVKATITGNHIKAILKQKGMTQEELSRRVRVSHRHINRLVLRRSEPSLLLALRIATVLNTTPEQVFNIAIQTRPALES